MEIFRPDVILAMTVFVVAVIFILYRSGKLEFGFAEGKPYLRVEVAQKARKARKRLATPATGERLAERKLPTNEATE